MEAPCTSGCVLCLLLHRPTSHLSFACRFSPGLCSAAALSPQPCCDHLLPGSRLLSMPLLPLLRRVLRQHAMLPVPSPTSDPLPTPTLFLLVPQACCDHLLTRGRLFCLPALPLLCQILRQQNSHALPHIAFPIRGLSYFFSTQAFPPSLLLAAGLLLSSPTWWLAFQPASPPSAMLSSPRTCLHNHHCTATKHVCRLAASFAYIPSACASTLSCARPLSYSHRPAVIISYLVAGFSACLPSLCYAEISASML